MGDSVDNNIVTETAIDALNLEEKKDDFVDPWNVQSNSDTGIDYDKLIRKQRYFYTDSLTLLYAYSHFFFNANLIHLFVVIILLFFTFRAIW